MSKSSEYWRIRERENRQRLKTLKFIDSYNRQIDTIYRNMLDSAQKEIDAFYGKYASDEGITIAEAKKRVSQLDIEAYGRKAKRFVANKTFTDKANAEMKIYNLTMKVNRLELLKSNIGLELVNGFDELEKLFGEKITEEGIKEFRRQAGILGDTVVDTDKDKRYRKQADRIARASFHNATFSDRIWMHQDLLRNEIDKALQKALISGTSMERLARDIRNAFGASTKNAQRLMRTEIRRMQTDAAMESYRRNGNEKYEYMALGQRPCDACRALEGKVFNVKDIEIGVNAPPMHPNCMCSTAPYVDEKVYNEWLKSFDNDNGRINEKESEEYRNGEVERKKKKYKSRGLDVTELYLQDATPMRGSIDYEPGFDKTRGKKEEETARLIHKLLGGNIVLKEEKRNQKNPDYEWLEMLWDLKTTSTPKSANKAIRTGLKQIHDNPGGIILNYSSKNFDIDELLKVIDKRMMWYPDDSADIMIIINKKIAKVLRY